MPVSRSARRFWSFALALALVAAQWAAQSHSFEHARYELALAVAFTANPGGAAMAAANAANPDQEQDQDGLPRLGHSRDHCVAFQGLDCSAVSLALPVLDRLPPPLYLAEYSLDFTPAASPPFSSRAPPVLS